jgi:hypothetical protein
MYKKDLFNYSLFHIIKIIGILLMMNYSLSASDFLRKNGFILDSLTNEISKSILKSSSNFAGKNTLLKINDCPSSTFVVNQLLLNNQNTGIIFHRIEDSNVSSYFKLDMFIKDYSVYYFNCISSNDSLIRKFDISISCSSTGKMNPDVNAANNFYISHTDTIAIADIPYIENQEFKFSYMPLPKPQKSLWQDFGQPALILTTAIITIILLFTVRSGK